MPDISIYMKLALQNLSTFEGGEECAFLLLSILGPKKNERWTMLLPWSKDIFVVVVSSNSWCTQVTRGGFLALKISLFHTGNRDGALSPLANSPTVFKNLANPSESLMGWFRRIANTNPPHANRVTCTRHKHLSCFSFDSKRYLYIITR